MTESFFTNSRYLQPDFDRPISYLYYFVSNSLTITQLILSTTLTTPSVKKPNSNYEKGIFPYRRFYFSFYQLTLTQFPETVKSQFVKDWERVKAFIHAYFGVRPKDKFGFKAQESIRGFSQQMQHRAQDIIIMISYGTCIERIWAGRCDSEQTFNIHE
jgi:hypothetical protein